MWEVSQLCAEAWCILVLNACLTSGRTTTLTAAVPQMIAITTALSCVSAGSCAATAGAVMDSNPKLQCQAMTVQQARADSGSQAPAIMAEQSPLKEQEHYSALLQEAARLQCQETKPQCRQPSAEAVEAEDEPGTIEHDNSALQQAASNLQQVHYLLCLSARLVENRDRLAQLAV